MLFCFFFVFGFVIVLFLIVVFCGGLFFELENFFEVEEMVMFLLLFWEKFVWVLVLYGGVGVIECDEVNLEIYYEVFEIVFVEG